jgi:hypothetical protein
VASTGILTATTPQQARHTWPRRLLIGFALVAAAVLAVVLRDQGSRIVLGAAGLAAAGRGLLIVRAVWVHAVEPDARRLGVPLAAAGVAAVVVAAVSAAVTGGVLVVVVPLLLLAASGALLGQGGPARRGGQVLLVWSVLLVALLVAAGVALGWEGAAAVATGMGALSLAGLGAALLVGAVNLRSVAAQAPANAAYPAPAGGCGGCACGAGGCGGAAAG